MDYFICHKEIEGEAGYESTTLMPSFILKNVAGKKQSFTRSSVGLNNIRKNDHNTLIPLIDDNYQTSILPKKSSFDRFKNKTKLYFKRYKAFMVSPRGMVLLLFLLMVFSSSNL